MPSGPDERWRTVTDASVVADALTAAETSGNFLWILLDNPDDDAIAHVSELLGLHPVAVVDLRDRHEAPRLQLLPEQLYVTMWDLPEDGHATDRLVTVTLVASDRWLLTVLRGPADGDRLEAALADPTPPARTPVDAALALVTDVARRCAIAATQIEDDLERLEGDVFDPSITEDVRSVYDVRRSIGRIDRAVSGLAAAFEAAEGDLASLAERDPDRGPYLRHLVDHVAGATGVTEDQAKALDAVVSSHESNVSMQQNRDMRTISAFAALLAIPTVIAGLYGMNFPNLPLLQADVGWVVVGGVIIVLDVIAYVVFKRRHWV